MVFLIFEGSTSSTSESIVRASEGSAVGELVPLQCYSGDTGTNGQTEFQLDWSYSIRVLIKMAMVDLVLFFTGLRPTTVSSFILVSFLFYSSFILVSFY